MIQKEEIGVAAEEESSSFGGSQSRKKDNPMAELCSRPDSMSIATTVDRVRSENSRCRGSRIQRSIRGIVRSMSPVDTMQIKPREVEDVRSVRNTEVCKADFDGTIR